MILLQVSQNVCMTVDTTSPLLEPLSGFVPSLWLDSSGEGWDGLEAVLSATDMRYGISDLCALQKEGARHLGGTLPHPPLGKCQVCRTPLYRQDSSAYQTLG